VAAERVAAAQQRLQRAQRRSKNRDRKREAVAARHRKIANQRKDFHHKQARELVERYDLLVVEDLHIANLLRRGQTRARPGQPRSVPQKRRPGQSGLFKEYR